jgi:hypothetical protein
MIVAVLAAGAGCGTPAATAGHATAATPVRTDVPEPATAPPVAQRPAGQVVALPDGPEGLAVDARDGILAARIRQPAGVAGSQLEMIDPGTPRTPVPH